MLYLGKSAGLVRSITYLHQGARIQGIKRDTASYLKSFNGLQYDSLEPKKYHDQIRSILNLASYKIDLSNELLLQCFTHKSFAHGSKPYNEKLSMLGLQFLKYNASIYSITHKDASAVDFSQLGQQIPKLLISRPVLSNFVKQKKLDSFIFARLNDPLNQGHILGEHTISSSVLNATLAAILLTSGEDVASEYVTKELIQNPNGPSLASLAMEYDSQTGKK